VARVSENPTLREILEGYKRFNAWELQEEKKELPQLTIEESLTQFFELCDLMHALAPDVEQIPKVCCDLGTAKDKKKSAKYDSIIIPQRVVCQKCGAVDQYEIGAMGRMALIADLLMQAEPKLQQFRREDQRVQ
jgi:hypothetical protein